MGITLKQCVAGIRTGQTFKGTLDRYDAGEVAVLLPKDIVSGEVADPIRIGEHAIPGLKKHLLKKGEILVVNRGAKFHAWLYDNSPHLAVANTAFYVITPADNILPEYLQWYLGQKEAKEYFAANTKGSTIPIITKGVLEALPVPLIPIKEQQYICAVVAESRHEQSLLKDLLEKRAEFAECFVWEHIQKNLK